MYTKIKVISYNNTIFLYICVILSILMALLEEQNSREILRAAVLKKLSSTKKKKFSEKSVDDLGWTFRVFLIKFLNLNYEFTHEELLSEIARVRIKKDLRNRVLALSGLLEEMKYGSRDAAKEDFEWMVNEAERVINLAIIGREFQDEARQPSPAEAAQLQKQKESIIRKLGGFLKVISQGKKPESAKKQELKKGEAQIKLKSIKSEADKSLISKMDQWKSMGYDTAVLEKIYIQESEQKQKE